MKIAPTLVQRSIRKKKEKKRKEKLKKKTKPSYSVRSAKARLFPFVLRETGERQYLNREFRLPNNSESGNTIGENNGLVCLLGRLQTIAAALTMQGRDARFCSSSASSSVTAAVALPRCRITSLHFSFVLSLSKAQRGRSPYIYPCFAARAYCGLECVRAIR